MSNNDSQARQIATDYLHENAEKLVKVWIDWLQERVQTTTIKSLPERALRNHIPPILHSLANFISNPAEITRQEILGHLKIHGQIRRDQGYTLEEVLAEFDGLAGVITADVNSVLFDAIEKLTPKDIIEALTNLASGLRTISFVAMGTYSQTDRERAKTTSEGMEEMTRAVVHELRNPLNAVTLNLGLIKEDNPNIENLEESVDLCLSSINQASEILNSIKNLALIDLAMSGKYLITLREIAESLKSEYKEETVNKGVEIRFEDHMPEVSIEAVPLYIVLTNLITNSIKYADKTKDEQFVSIKAKLIEEENDSGFCQIEVRDNGIGIPEELLARVCQKGFRAHPGVGQGTGYGLHYARDSLLTRGGALEIESKENEGTIVKVRIRCLSPESDAICADQYRIEHLMGEKVFENNYR